MQRSNSICRSHDNGKAIPQAMAELNQRRFSRDSTYTLTGHFRDAKRFIPEARENLNKSIIQREEEDFNEISAHSTAFELKKEHVEMNLVAAYLRNGPRETGSVSLQLHFVSITCSQCSWKLLLRGGYCTCELSGTFRLPTT